MKNLDVKNILNIEKQFHLQTYGEHFSHELISGTGCVMISAPHSVTQTRNGELKYSETYTGALAILLHQITGCPIIYKTRNHQDDANYDINHPYKSDLIEYVKQNNIKLLIDLHMMAPHRGFDIDLGTLYGENIHINSLITEDMAKIFNSHSLSDVRVNHTFYAAPRTVSSTIAKECKIDGIQVEINSSLLRTLEENPKTFFQVLESFKEIIEFYNRME